MNPPVDSLPEARPMTVEQALDFFEKVCAPVNAPKVWHQQVDIALQTLRDATKK